MKNLFTQLLSIALLFGFINPASADCPTIDDVDFPPYINVSDNTLSFDTYTDQLNPFNLVSNYNFTEAEAYTTW